MDIKLKLKKENPIETTIALPVSRKLKKELEAIKSLKEYDINSMLREYAEQIVAEINKRVS